jgi:hypothetical protein
MLKLTDHENKKGSQLMDMVFVFFLIATPVLGLLCLIVLEYQNSRTRQWTRSWSLPSALRPSQTETPPAKSSPLPDETRSSPTVHVA